MKTSFLLHSEISQVIARAGHTQSLTIADVGLPIPLGQQCIDLAVSRNLPRFMDVLRAVASEFCFERVVIAEEMLAHNPAVHEQLGALLAQYARDNDREIAIEYCAHEQFKVLSNASNAVVRTGECSPFANIILYAGVTF